ncbi:TPA_asm: LapB repeat-containing protein [Listeria monocytogenes]|nr:LapB repeat-containing protein [Listeria monocytogenes]
MKRENRFLGILIVACVIFSSLLLQNGLPVHAEDGTKRDDLIKSVSFYKSNGSNVSLKEEYNKDLAYFIDVAFAGNSFQTGDYFDITLSNDALLYTEETYDLTIDVDPTADVRKEVVGNVSINKNSSTQTLRFNFTESSDSYFIKGFDGNFKIQLMPSHGGKNSISLSYKEAFQKFKNINSSNVEINVNVASEWPPLGPNSISRISGDLYRAQQVYEKPKSKVNYETEILVSYPLFDDRIPLGNVQNIKVEIWDESSGSYRTGVAGVDYGTITYETGTPYIGGPSYKMNCSIPFLGISSKTRVTFDLNTNVDGKSGSTDLYLIGLSSVTSATKSVQFYPVNNAVSNINTDYYGKITTSFEDEFGTPVTFTDYSTAIYTGGVNENGKYEVAEQFPYDSTQTVNKHAFDAMLQAQKYKLVDVTSPNLLSETDNNLNIQIKLGYDNDVLYKIRALQKPIIQALPEVEYSKTMTRTKVDFLGDVEATTDIPATIDCDLSNVDWGVPGDYPVVITAINEDDQEADPVTVMVHILKKPAPVITVDPEITYKKTVTKDEVTLLSEVNARTNDGSTITSDIDKQVKWGVPGDYLVTLNAENEDGVSAESKTFIVHILKSPAPIIMVDSEITYFKTITKTEPELLSEVNARTNNGSPIISDTLTEVKWGVPGEYKVTLNAMNEDGVSAESKTFIVKILKSPAPIITVDPEVTYDTEVKKAPEVLLAEVHAKTNDHSAIFSDAKSQVKWGIPGNYLVTLNATNEDGVSAEPVSFIVHIVKTEEKPMPRNDKLKDKSENKLTINEKKLPQTGDKNSTGTIGGLVLCPGIWLYFRKGH